MNFKFRATTSITLLQLFLPFVKIELVDAASPSGVDLATCEQKLSNFVITLVDAGVTPAGDRYVQAFEDAKKRWEAVIINDLTDYPASNRDWFGGVLSKTYTGVIDDIVIGYEMVRIDGVGGTLGLAGPVLTRKSGQHKGTVLSGIMKFDLNDFKVMTDNDVRTIILHEMGHVLGLVGSIQDSECIQGCNKNNNAEQAVYKCELANAEYEALVGEQLFLENDGGTGTACAHWEEESFLTSESSELMTGFFEATLYQPLSLVTVAALDDIEGYEVDYCGADIWPATDDTVKKFPIAKPDSNRDSINVGRTNPVGIDVDGLVDKATDIWNKFKEWFNNNKKLGYAAVAGAAFLIFAMCVCCCRKRPPRRSNNTGHGENKDSWRVSSWEDDRYATNRRK